MRPETVVTGRHSLIGMRFFLQVTGMGFRHYWQHRGNRVDMVISLLAAVDIVSEFFVGDRGDFNLHFVPLLRLVGALRLVRLVRMLSGLNALVSTLLASLPSLGTVGAALLLLIFAYSYAAMQVSLFLRLSHNAASQYAPETGLISPFSCILLRSSLANPTL